MAAKILMVGSIMMDLILQMPRIPHPSESILGTTYSNAGGGKGANSAVAAAKAGGEVSVCCTMGQDANGEALLGMLKDVKVDDKEFVRIEAIICSMTKKERRNPKILNGSRRLRIAKGSGTTVQEINKFMKSFELTQTMMKRMKSQKGGINKMLKGMDINQLKGMM